MMADPSGSARFEEPSRLFSSAHWWLFCLGISGFNLLALLIDPSPKLFMGDSGAYLWTALSGWIPPDRSYLYGYVIRWTSLWAKSLTPLLILQAVVGAGTAIVVAVICRRIFGLSSRLSFLFGVLCSLDPLQLVWQRYVMTETISLFCYALVLLFSFFYFKERRLWRLAAVQTLSVLLISFRMSFLLLVQLSAVLLPLIAFLPEILGLFRQSSSAREKIASIKPAGLHLGASILIMLVLHQGYRQLNGKIAHREAAYLHASGLSLLTTWAPVLEPADAPDPRLADLISQGEQFGIKNMWNRDAQLYSPGGLAGRWKQIERRAEVRDRLAKEAALHALKRNPTGVATLGAKTFLAYWDLNRVRRQMKRDLGKVGNNWTKKEKWDVADYFHLSPPRPGDATSFTLLQGYFLHSVPYYYVVLLCPIICGVLVFFLRTAYMSLLFVHSWILLATVTVLSKAISVRYVQPISLLTILTVAALVHFITSRRSRLPVHWRAAQEEAKPA